MSSAKTSRAVSGASSSPRDPGAARMPLPAAERDLFRLAQGAGSDAECEEARECLLQRYERLALRLARRFSDRGEAREDLEQVARIGLLNSMRRFDPDRGVRFTTYATQTVLGELKKHFRDRGWGLRVPRSLQELNLTARRAADRLSQELGRSPSVEEVASASGRAREQTREALELGQQAYELASRDEATDDGEGGTSALGEVVAERQSPIADFRAMTEADALLDALPTRLRSIVRWRHLEGLSQTEIAGRLGISQMHVSRLYRRAIAALQAMQDDEGAGG